MHRKWLHFKNFLFALFFKRKQFYRWPWYVFMLHNPIQMVVKVWVFYSISVQKNTFVCVFLSENTAFNQHLHKYYATKNLSQSFYSTDCLPSEKVYVFEFY